jgi:Sulfotransferase domain
MSNKFKHIYRHFSNVIPVAIKQPFRKSKIPFNRLNRRLSAYFDDSDLYLVSYPCSGRTWLRVLIGKALCDRFELDQTIMLDTPHLTETAGILKTMYTHDCSLVEDYYFYLSDDVFFDKARFSKKKIILLVRDPKDVIVSYYSHIAKRDGKYDGSISDFIRDDKFGIEKLLRFYNIWFENQHLLKDFLLITYEEIRAEPAKNLNKILAFMGVEDIQSEILENAVQFASFDNMQQLEKKNFFENYASAGILKPRSSNPESSKVRKGKIGGYSDHLSNEDIEFINKSILEIGCPLYLKSTSKNS